MRSCFYRWYRGQVVRQESAKLSSASSNLAGTSKKRRTRLGSSFFGGTGLRFEDINATVLWTVAADGSTEANNNFSSHRGEKCKQIWPVPMGLRHI